MANVTVIVTQRTQKVSLKISQDIADMTKGTYDTNSSGVVDNSEKVNNLTVEKAVPSTAKFTDTVYDDSVLDTRVDNLETSTSNIDNTSDVDKPVSDATAIELAKKIIPLFPYVEGQVANNTMTTRNGWAMISNKVTSDLPDPQEVGSPVYALDKDDVFALKSDTSILNLVHIITATKAGYLSNLEIFTPSWNLDAVTKVTFTNVTTGASKSVDNPILKIDEWNLLSSERIIVKIGDVIKVEFKYYNSSAADAINGDWDANLGTGIPNANDINIDDLGTPTVIEISHTDLDSGDRSTELDGVSVDSTITITETGDVNRNVELKVTAVDLASATSTKYTVDVISNGNKDVRDGNTCNIHIDIPITQPSEYYSIDAYYPTNNPDWGTITTERYYNGVLQVDAVDNNAYGINLLFQEATVSDDWEFVAFSGSSGVSTSTSKSTYVFSKVTSLLNIGDVYVPLTSISESNIKIGSVYEIKMSVRGTFTDTNDSLYIRYRLTDGASVGGWNEFVHQSKSADDTWIFNYFFPRTATNTSMSIEMEIRKETGGQQLDVLFANAIIDEKI